MAELFNRFGDCIFTTEEDVTLEMAVVDLLQKKHLTMATAESCTGGMIAARLVNVSGVSMCLCREWSLILTKRKYVF